MLDQGRDQPIEWRLALCTARVAFEEEPLDRPERRQRRTTPAHANRFCRVVGQFAEALVLIAFDRFDYRGQQPLARPEMVNQHTVTGPDLPGEVTQRSSGESALGGRFDHTAEQGVAPLRHRGCAVIAIREAAAICSLRCFSPAASMARYRRVSERHRNAASRPIGPEGLMDCSATVRSPTRVRT